MGLGRAPGNKEVRQEHGSWYVVNTDLNIRNGPFKDEQDAQAMLNALNATKSTDRPTPDAVARIRAQINERAAGEEQASEARDAKVARAHRVLVDYMGVGEAEEIIDRLIDVDVI